MSEIRNTEKYNEINDLIVRFHNDMNKMSISNMTEQEHNLLCALLYLMSDKDGELTLSFEQAIDYAGRMTSYAQYTGEFLEKFGIKASQAICPMYVISNEGDEKLVIHPFFSKFEVNYTEKEICVKINEEFKYFVNSLETNYTAISYNKFKEKENVYVKTLYKMLSQYKVTGWMKISIDDLMRMLDAPRSYGTGKFHDRILNPTIEALSSDFKGLNVTYHKKGRSIVGYKFSWSNEEEKERRKNQAKKAEEESEYSDDMTPDMIETLISLYN